MFDPTRGPEFVAQSPFLVPSSIRDTQLSGHALITHLMDVVTAVAPRHKPKAYTPFHEGLKRIPVHGFATNCTGHMMLLHATAAGFEELDPHGVVVSYNRNSKHWLNAVRHSEGVTVIDTNIDDREVGSYVEYIEASPEPDNDERDAVIRTSVHELLANGPLQAPAVMWFAKKTPATIDERESPYINGEPLARRISDDEDMTAILESKTKVTILPRTDTNRLIDRTVSRVRLDGLTG